ncbi:MAG TPA: glutathione S-transferase, partial [Xanthomonadales bacterium]|nr:glutathione S-transferase [Xanthomonadales bacterium]
MLTLHHLENSRSQRILWLLEELGIEYKVKKYKRDKETQLAPPEMVKVHPLGKSPVVTDDELTVAESGAIIEYLLGNYGDGNLVPAEGTPERLAYTYWMHYAEGSLMPFMVLSLIMNKIETAPMPFFIRPVAKGIVGKVKSGYLDTNVQRNLEFLESTLENSS